MSRPVVVPLSRISLLSYCLERVLVLSSHCPTASALLSRAYATVAMSRPVVVPLSRISLLSYCLERVLCLRQEQAIIGALFLTTFIVHIVMVQKIRQHDILLLGLAVCDVLMPTDLKCTRGLWVIHLQL